MRPRRRCARPCPPGRCAATTARRSAGTPGGHGAGARSSRSATARLAGSRRSSRATVSTTWPGRGPRCGGRGRRARAGPRASRVYSAITSPRRRALRRAASPGQPGRRRWTSAARGCRASCGRGRCARRRAPSAVASTPVTVDAAVLRRARPAGPATRAGLAEPPRRRPRRSSSWLRAGSARRSAASGNSQPARWRPRSRPCPRRHRARAGSPRAHADRDRRPIAGARFVTSTDPSERCATSHCVAATRCERRTVTAEPAAAPRARRPCTAASPAASASEARQTSPPTMQMPVRTVADDRIADRVEPRPARRRRRAPRRRGRAARRTRRGLAGAVRGCMGGEAADARVRPRAVAAGRTSTALGGEVRGRPIGVSPPSRGRARRVACVSPRRGIG